MLLSSMFELKCYLLALVLCSIHLVLGSPTAQSSPLNPPSILKPTVVLAPAAWHLPIHYADFLNRLKSAGYETITRKLPSCDSSNPSAQSVSTDAEFIKQELLLPSINAGKEVVLLTHSYSGGPGAMAAKGLSVTERRALGRRGGIIGLIYICAFIAEEGQSLLSASGGQFAPWVIQYVSDALNCFHRRFFSLTIISPAARRPAGCPRRPECFLQRLVSVARESVRCGP